MSQPIEILLEALRRDGVVDEAVLAAIAATPREVFVEDAFSARAYENLPLPIDRGQTISQPTIVGLMTQALKLDPRCKVLEIGAGSGYQSAILARLCRRVYAIERHEPLFISARARLEKLQITNVVLSHADGGLGWPEQAPFDRILAAAAAPDVPHALLEQLRPGGIMVLPIGEQDGEQELLRVRKDDSGMPEYDSLGPVRFVPMVEGTA